LIEGNAPRQSWDKPQTNRRQISLSVRQLPVFDHGRTRVFNTLEQLNMRLLLCFVAQCLLNYVHNEAPY